MKKTSLLHAISFILFVAWGIGSLLNAILGYLGTATNIVSIVEKILSICAMVVMIYCAYLYYANNKRSKIITVLFWIAAAVAIASVIIMFF